MLSASEGAALVELARAAIEDRLLGGDLLAAVRARTSLTEALVAPRACFVTLELHEASGAASLRGCIGSTEPLVPAHEAVVQAAEQAAFADPRFAPLSKDELPSVALTVSALTAMTPIASPDAIVVGVHGVALAASGRKAIFLPEVARRYGWSSLELVRQLALKAGLPDGAWRRGVLRIFTCESFSEAPGRPARIPRS